MTWWVDWHSRRRCHDAIVKPQNTSKLLFDNSPEPFNSVLDRITPQDMMEFNTQCYLASISVLEAIIRVHAHKRKHLNAHGTAEVLLRTIGEVLQHGIKYCTDIAI